MKKLRRTMLFCPASNPKLLFNAPIYKPDCIIFDLEDAVKYDEKESARDLLVEALKTVDYESCEVFARINSLKTEFGKQDAIELVRAGLRRIRLPMCETTEDVLELNSLLNMLEEELSLEPNCVKVQCAIETPLGVHNALQIATACERVISISFGAEDYTRTLGVNRTKEATELFLPRSMVAQAAAIAGIDAIDTVWADFKDIEGFEREVKSAMNLGFAGKSCIHPSQVSIIHNLYTPNQKEIEKSIEIVKAAEEANVKNGGVITLNGKMIDIPVIAKAQRIVDLAIGAGVIKDV